MMHSVWKLNTFVDEQSVFQTGYRRILNISTKTRLLWGSNVNIIKGSRHLPGEATRTGAKASTLGAARAAATRATRADRWYITKLYM